VSVWDTTGDWENNSIRENNIKDADRVLVVFDYENKNSIEKVAKVDLSNLSKIKRIKNAVMIGNKIEKEKEDAVLDAIMVAEKYRIPLYFTSTNNADLVKSMKHKILF
jgi:GTPase SAR1 family protein